MHFFECLHIIRTSYSNKEDDFDQERLYQYQKKVEYDVFAKRVTFKTSSEAFYVIAYVNEQYAFVYGFYSDALKDVVSIYYEIDYINKNLFKNLWWYIRYIIVSLSHEIL